MKRENKVRSCNDWLKAGRQVLKGEWSVRGLFHVSQTNPINDRDPGFVDLDRAMRTSPAKGGKEAEPLTSSYCVRPPSRD